jgi:hypothetical protein
MRMLHSTSFTTLSIVNLLHCSGGRLDLVERGGQGEVLKLSIVL